MTGTPPRSCRLPSRINVLLYRLGVRQQLLRHCIRFQMALTAVLLLAGLLLWPLSPWFFWFSIGALLSLWSFFSLTKIAPQFMVAYYTPSVGIALFIRSQLRLLAILFAGGACVLWLSAPIGALLAGFSSMLASIVVIVLFFKKRAHHSCKP